MKIKILVILLLVMVLTGLVYYFNFYQKGEVKKEEITGLGVANPAAVYCQEQGGESENKVFPSGERGFCLFPDNSRCDEWDLYRGDCAKGQLKIEVLEEGTGDLADNEDFITVHYTGWLTDGTVFDSTADKGLPFSFTLGVGRVIQGWEQGVLGMQVGEKIRLTIAPELAYGETGVPDIIPPNATIIFEVELLAINGY